MQEDKIRALYYRQLVTPEANIHFKPMVIAGILYKQQHMWSRITLYNRSEEQEGEGRTQYTSSHV